MRTAGIRELKENASKLVRLVREDRQEVAITYRGKVVARLVPADDAEEERQASSETSAALYEALAECRGNATERDAAIWRDLDALCEEVTSVWPEGVSAVDAIREQRREL